jgi:acetyl-CoA C-acetyltransferase
METRGCLILRNVAIVGIGMTPLRPTTPELSYKELIYEAAVKAYEDAGVDPRRDIESLVCSSEDFWEGTSIFDEYVPDQLGAVLKPVCTISADGMYSLATAYMQILTGAFDIVAVEAHSKASDIVNISSIYDLALDPIYTRPLGFNANFIAGLEMNKFLHSRGADAKHCRMVPAKNRRNALANTFAMNGGNMDDNSVTKSLSDPLTAEDVAPIADGAAAIVLASEDVARKITDSPVWIDGVGWNLDTTYWTNRDLYFPRYVANAARMAYGMAGIHNPRKEIDFAEPYDPFDYKELHHMEGLLLCRKGEAPKLTVEGVTQRDGKLPICPSGGLLGVGNPIAAAGMMKICELFWQLRGEAGKRQVAGDPRTAVAQAWGDLMQIGTVVVMRS